MKEYVKQEVNYRVDTLPRQQLNRWFKISIFVIIALVSGAVAGNRLFYISSQKARDEKINEILCNQESFSITQDQIMDSIATMRVDMNIGFSQSIKRDSLLQHKQNIYVETLPAFQRRLILELDKRYKLDRSFKDESYIIPLNKVKPIQSELQVYAPDIDFKKKLIQ